MKTLEQAAREYAQEERKSHNEFDAFLEGAKYTQTWIPESSAEKPKEREVVLVKFELPIKSGSLMMSSLASYSEFDKSWFIFNTQSMTNKKISTCKVTHWRPIEFE